MVMPESRRQRILRKKAARAKARRPQTQLRPVFFSTAKQMSLAVNSPVHACYVNDFREHGMAFILFARKIPDGKIAVGHFLVDTYALGVKDAFFRVFSEPEYDNFIALKKNELERIHPTCARKLVEGAVDFAERFRFKPHSDYKFAKIIFGDIDRDACPLNFEFGKNGQPLVITGTMHPLDVENGYSDSPPGFLYSKERIDDNDETIRVFEYEISTEPVDHEYMRNIPDSVVDEMNELHDLALTGTEEGFEKIKEFIYRYPNLPQPHNYLYAAYTVAWEKEKAAKVAEECLRQFPNYLFGKIACAGIYMEKKEFHKVAEIFQNNLELSYHCNGRTKVHVSEFVKFYAMVCRYCFSTGSIEIAKTYFEMLKAVVPNSPETRWLERKIYPSLLSRWIKKLFAR